ncbi:MAG: class I SAM-dependent methyltransferase [Methanobacteriota archaeon]
MAPATLSSTRREWDRIAERFSAARGEPWAEVRAYASGLDPGGRVLDLACGNGRHAFLLAELGLKPIALDFSLEFLRIVEARRRERDADVRVVAASAVDLPLASASVDHVIFVAGLHHVPGKADRVKSLREILRVLKPGGTCFVSVWALWQDRFLAHFLREALLYPFRRGRAGGEFGDIEVPWMIEGVRAPRFYHLMTNRELVTSAKRAGFLLRESWSASLTGSRLPDNHFAVLQKPRELLAVPALVRPVPDVAPAQNI